jgi:hypothetical protein
MFKAMFKDLFNFKKQRTPMEAAVFFAFYAGLCFLTTTLLGQ